METVARVELRARLIFVGREAVIWISFALAYFAIRGLTEGSVEQATANAHSLIELEQRIGIHHEEALQDLIIDHRLLVSAANWVYIWLHWPAIAFMAVFLALKHPGTYRVIRTAFVISGSIGLVIFALFPVSPPRFVMPGVVDTVTEHSRSYRVLQPPQLTNKYAAMPSLHFGWNMLVGLALVWRARLWPVRVAGGVIPFLMFWAIVLTANHYFLDGIVGGALALFGLLVSYTLYRILDGRRTPPGDSTRENPDHAGPGAPSQDLPGGTAHRSVAWQRAAGAPG
jgi:membrane-associated phospholipid phosphatase